jgi:NAD-dependent deacetylase
MPDVDLSDSLRRAQQILVFTGAGISTSSGIPDYRGPQGIWKTRKPVYYQDFMSSEDARVEYWDQKAGDWDSYRDAQPNAVHRAVAALEKAGKLACCVTQNIDGLHEKAGTSRDLLVELHGTNGHIECQTCHRRSPPQPHFDAFRKTRAAPLCDGCGGFLKPATISFGQPLRHEDMQAGAEAATTCDLVVALGSTLSVYPAAEIPLLAAQRGVPYIIVNRGPTDHDELSLVSLRLEGDLVAIFAPAVARALDLADL